MGLNIYIYKFTSKFSSEYFQIVFILNDPALADRYQFQKLVLKLRNLVQLDATN